MSKKVSRGTQPAAVVRDWPFLFKKAMWAAIVSGAKTETRRIVTKQNSDVDPGTFDGVDFSTGRARRVEVTALQDAHPRVLAEIRAQCKFESGSTRVVSVHPKIQAGDRLWAKANRFTSRAKSNGTLEVLVVDVARVQDMTDAEAIAEGVLTLPHVQEIPVELTEPRWLFSRLWDEINGAGAWDRNDWVWIYRFRRLPTIGDANVQEEKAHAAQ
jgi:hypothetical protein